MDIGFYGCTSWLSGVLLLLFWGVLSLEMHYGDPTSMSSNALKGIALSSIYQCIFCCLYGLYNYMGMAREKFPECFHSMRFLLPPILVALLFVFVVTISEDRKLIILGFTVLMNGGCFVFFYKPETPQEPPKEIEKKQEKVEV